MPVSAGLQKYFDSRRGKKDDTHSRLAAIAGQIDPAFSASFSNFREQILGIIEEHPEEAALVCEELDELDQELQTRRQKHDLKKAKVLIDMADTL